MHSANEIGPVGPPHTHTFPVKRGRSGGGGRGRRNRGGKAGGRENAAGEGEGTASRGREGKRAGRAVRRI